MTKLPANRPNHRPGLKLTEDVIEQILDRYAKGEFLTDICASLNIDKAAWYMLTARDPGVKQRYHTLRESHREAKEEDIEDLEKKIIATCKGSIDSPEENDLRLAVAEKCAKTLGAIRKRNYDPALSLQVNKMAVVQVIKGEEGYLKSLFDAYDSAE